MKFVNVYERSTFHKSWVMLDKSVVVQGLPDFTVCDTVHKIPSFGDIKVGQPCSTSQHISSIQIKLFRLEKYWRYAHCDAYVRITLVDDDGNVMVRGFHADATNTLLDKVNSMLFVRKQIKYTETDGSCPICLETDMAAMHPLQAANSTCGHGVCHKCFIRLQNAYRPKCPLCRAPISK